MRSFGKENRAFKGLPLQTPKSDKLIKLERNDFDEDGLAFAFAALGEPCGEALSEASWGEAEAGFDAAVRDGERVVEIGGVGEIAHAELVEPVEWTRLFLAVDDDVDRELLRVHASILALSFKLTRERGLAQLARAWGIS